MATEKRLSGKCTYIDAHIEKARLIVTIPSMTEAIERMDDGLRGYLPSRTKPKAQAWKELVATWRHFMLHGDINLPLMVEQADEIIKQVLVLDPRLALATQWSRAEDEGISLDPGALETGERPFINRSKRALRPTQDGPRYKVVISTDSNKQACIENFIGFVAAAKLAQQFRPLEVWWQSAWMIPEDTYYGVAFLVPLVTNELDFARLQWVLSCPRRDTLAYLIMRAVSEPPRTKYHHKFGATPGEYSFLEGTDDFIPESGIKPAPYNIAYLAARWAGLEPLWAATPNSTEALQSWAPIEINKPATSDPEADKLYWQKQRETELADRNKKHTERMSTLNN